MAVFQCIIYSELLSFLVNIFRISIFIHVTHSSEDVYAKSFEISPSGLDMTWFRKVDRQTDVISTICIYTYIYIQITITLYFLFS